MMLGCLLAVLLAVWFAVPPPPARAIRGRLARSERHPTRPQRPWPRWLGVGGAVSALAVTGAALRGPAGVTIALAIGAALLTVGRLLTQHRARRRAAIRRLAVARGCAAIASQVRVGRVPGEALGSAAEDWPVLAGAHQAQQLGGDVAQALLAQAERPGCAGLADLARAWRLTTETGAPMATALDHVAASLRRDEALQRTVAAELAGPRATGKVMAALPVAGIAMGYLLGGRPVEFLVEGPPGWGCLLGGVLLACAGVLWVDRLARVAEVT